MIAKYKGTCSECGKEILPGQVISWSRQEGGKVYHIECQKRRSMAAAASSTVATDSNAELLAALKQLLARTPSAATVDLSTLAPTAESAPASAPVTMPPKAVIPPPATPAIRVKAKLSKNAEWYDTLEAVLPHVNRVLLVGPPSTGKSTTSMIVGGIKHRITMTETTSREDGIGMFHLIDGATVWVDGPFTKAMRNGEAILVDEIDRYSPEFASLLYSLIDDKPHITLPSGELVEAKDGYKVIMTTNDSIETLPVAVQDRIEVVLIASTPHPDALSGMTKAQQEVVVRYYKAIPEKQFKLFTTVRRMRTFTRLLSVGFPSELAAKLVFDGGSEEVLSALTSAEGTATL